MCAWKDDDAAMHAMFALTGRCLSAGLAWDIGVKLEHGLLFDHDPSDPRIGDGQQEKEPHDGTGAKGKELNTKGKGKEDTCGEDVDGPFESHGISLILTESNDSTIL